MFRDHEKDIENEASAYVSVIEEMIFNDLSLSDNYSVAQSRERSNQTYKELDEIGALQNQLGKLV